MMANQIISQILFYLTEFSRFLQKYIGHFGLLNHGLPKVQYSWLVILFFVFVVFLVGLSLGRTRMLLSLVSLYIAFFLESHFVFFDQLKVYFKNVSAQWLHTILFLVIYIIACAILSRSILKYRFTLKEAPIIPVFIIGVFTIGFWASLLIGYLPQTTNPLPVKFTQYFATKNAQFWWASLALLSVLASKREKKREPTME